MTTFTKIYERVLVAPVFRPLAEQLVARIAPNRGDSVIDVACGTGIVAGVARAIDPTIEWRQGNAVSLSVGDASVSPW